MPRHHHRWTAVDGDDGYRVCRCGATKEERTRSVGRTRIAGLRIETPTRTETYVAMESEWGGSLGGVIRGALSLVVRAPSATSRALRAPRSPRR